LTLNWVILHTVVHHSSTSTYTPNFIEVEETFCGRTPALLVDLKRVTWSWPRPLGSKMSPNAKHLIYSTYIHNLATVASVVWIAGVAIKKWVKLHW